MTITTDPEFFCKQLLEAEDGFTQLRSRRNPIQSRHSQFVGNALEIKVYTVKEAAAALHPNVSKSAIYRAIQSGELRARMVGKKYLITERNLKDFLECQEEENHPASGPAKTKTSGSSLMEVNTSGRDVALRSANKLKKRSGTI
ncbi:helix-turn-helix domain-containing protein [Roseibium sp.]|uniref:helix-turn-helix domain-containing protein n=1 Tax=Roseibium sp. TaxID=1936156 RepID=UPI003BAABC11